MSSSSSAGANRDAGKYDGVIKSGLKLKGGGGAQKEIGIKKSKKKQKSEHELEVDALQEAAARQEAVAAELNAAATRGPTPNERAFQLAKEKREQGIIKEQIQYTHRQRMDRFNAHLGSLSEHFDIPKVGPG
eukprot:TRINITY_DN33311_c1_g1_i1.p1 TRINITY_DN33311_c1_g1~~TRINITY_DN33311_c1_g1_i1.p1  ORF type:complete len:147 (+),score=32.25 TRINITY_DN33311_c1_g1_i1:47-442(+)